MSSSDNVLSEESTESSAGGLEVVASGNIVSVLQGFHSRTQQALNRALGIDHFLPRGIIFGKWLLRVEHPILYGVHETYRAMYRGSFGPYTGLFIKQAKLVNGSNSLADNEVAVLAQLSLFGSRFFQVLRHVGFTEDHLYLALDFCSLSVKQAIDADHIISSADLSRLYRQLLEAFGYMKTSDLLHKDVCAQNVFLSSARVPSIVVGGFKHALDGNASRAERRRDIPVGRLAYRYFDYGNNAYSWKTEAYLLACIMDSL